MIKTLRHVTFSRHYDIFAKPRSRVTTAITCSRQNDAGSRSRTTKYWENLVLVIVLILKDLISLKMVKQYSNGLPVSPLGVEYSSIMATYTTPAELCCPTVRKFTTKTPAQTTHPHPPSVGESSLLDEVTSGIAGCVSSKAHAPDITALDESLVSPCFIVIRRLLLFNFAIYIYAEFLQQKSQLSLFNWESNWGLLFNSECSVNWNTRNA